MRLLVNHIYRPKRILYYIPATKELKDGFFRGDLPEELLKHNGKFGTYDYPGLFKIRKDGLEKEVFGIEFRPDDVLVDYPQDLDSIVLDGGFMTSAITTDVMFTDEESVDECVNQIFENADADIFYSKIHVDRNSDVIQVFTNSNKSRIFIRDISISREEFFRNENPSTPQEMNLYNAAYHDPVTGHFNWNYINTVIIGCGLKGIQDFIYCQFDIKDFNSINEIYGHNAGNRALSKVTEHLKKQDWIYCSARCDNDNFALMARDMSNEELQEKLKVFFSHISTLDEDPHYKIDYRCGVVPMREAMELGSRVADGAKLAKSMGTKLNETEILFYTDDMHNELFWAKKIKGYIDTAIENDEFMVYLQPKYNIETEKIEGAEALVRWHYQGYMMIQPQRFIPVLEKEGSISKVDDIVLRKVCECLAHWRDSGLPLHPISVNLSRRRMENPKLVEHLTAIVDSYGIDHSLIDFELTETAAYNNEDYMITVISNLKSAGYKISMDDFGTGFSSLSLLTMMPIDTLKIDKSFVDGIGTEKETYKERAVIKHIISMAKDLNLKCLAEGAEKRSQVDKLRSFGCETIQGYYYSSPIPVEEYEVLLKNEK